MALGDQSDPITVKQSDTLVVRGAFWQGTPSTPVSIVGGTVVYNMRLSTSPNTLVANRVATTTVDGANGIAEYSAPAPTVVGLYQAEFEATLSSGRVVTFPPGKNYIWIEVGDDIA